MVTFVVLRIVVVVLLVAANAFFVAAEFAQEPSRARIPQPQGPIVRSGHDSPAIAGIGQRPDRPAMAGQHA